MSTELLPTAFDGLRAELDTWTAGGVTARFWWRDDDAVAQTPQLDALLAMARRFTVQPGVAVIPARADASLQAIASARTCVIWQHGWDHTFHADGEFGDSRPLEAMVDEARAGQRAMDRLFGPQGWQRVFVPPNHALSMRFKRAFPTLGYRGVSAGVPLTPAIDGVHEVNAEIDVMDWPAGRSLPLAAVCGMLVDRLRERRGRWPHPEDPIGLLTHHLRFDEAAWATFSAVLEFLSTHHAAQLVDAEPLFAEPLETRRAFADGDRSTGAASVEPVTVVLTSCDRPDLLAITLDSFLRHNTYPIHRFLVMEDGPAVSSLAADERYRQANIEWQCTGRRLGQMPAIDLAYSCVDTEFIFHCEDDWEFTASGFIERSLQVLKNDPGVVQVWIRALGDTNNHPLMDETLAAGGVPYRLLRPGYDSPGWGVWHGFSFNPGLRRTSDYRKIGSFMSLDPERRKKPYEIEREASEFYFKQGLHAAILADGAGDGYVRHIGWGRHVAPPAEPGMEPRL